MNHTEAFFFIMFQKKSVLLFASSSNPDNGCNPLYTGFIGKDVALTPLKLCWQKMWLPKN